jgi:AcrR family transcriptional regulator
MTERHEGQRAGAVRKKPRGRYHHGDLRRALIDAALAIVEREGWHALTLRAAARLLGVSQAAPYRHFVDKDALLAAVAEEGLRTLSAWMREEAAPHEASPSRRLQALGVAYVKFAVAHPARFRVMFTAVVAEPDACPALVAAYEEMFGLLLDAIAACQRARLVREGDPRELALAAWSVVHGLADLSVGGQLPRFGLAPADTRALAEQVTSSVFKGLEPRAR